MYRCIITIDLVTTVIKEKLQDTSEYLRLRKNAGRGR